MLQLMLDRWRHTLEVDNLNPSFLSCRTWFSKRDVRIHSTVFTVFPNERLHSSFFGFSIVLSKRIRQCRDSNRQPPDLIHDELDHRTTVSCFRFADIWSQQLLFFRFGSEELFNHGDASDPDIVYDDEAVSKLLDRDQEVVEEQVKIITKQ